MRKDAMSDVTDLADAEAERAEAETADEPEAEPTPDEPAEEEVEGDEVGGVPAEPSDAEAAAQVVGMGEKEMEKMHKRVAQASASYAKKITEILGDEAQVLELCPRCVGGGFPGFIFPPLMAPVDPETKAAVLLSIGEEAPNVSEPDPYSRRCDACEGWGRVLSGSRLNQQKTLLCLPCHGRGWVAVGDERRVAQQAVTAPDVPRENGAPVEQPPEADPWGRGPEHPDYGRLPQFVGAG
jgi:hypothetical protein